MSGAALPERIVVLPNVRWIARDRGHEIEGEADLVIADPDRGLLVLEVKSGEIRRDDYGRWWAGSKRLERSPVRAGVDEPARPREEAAGAARLGSPASDPPPATPSPCRTSTSRAPAVASALRRSGRTSTRTSSSTSAPAAGRRCRGGPADLARAGLRALGREGGGSGTGNDRRARRASHPARPRQDADRAPLAAAQRDRRGRARGRRADRRPDRRPQRLRGGRRARSSAARGPARRCSRSRRPDASPARASRRSSSASTSRSPGCSRRRPRRPRASTGLLTVSTFHQLCEDLGREAGTLPTKPADPVPPEWFNETLPDALDAAIELRRRPVPRDRHRRGPGLRGRLARCRSRRSCDAEGGRPVRLPRPGPGDLPRRRGRGPRAARSSSLDENCRNAQPIHDFVRRFAGTRLRASRFTRRAGQPS